MATRQAAWVKERREEWKAAGLCPVCGKPKAEGKSKCQVCLDRTRDWKRARKLPAPKAPAHGPVTVAPQYLMELAMDLNHQHGHDWKMREIAKALVEAGETIRRLTKG